MGDKEVKKEEDATIGKKCAQTGKVLKKAKRYFRNGKYFLNKNAFKAYQDKMKGEEKPAEGAEAAAA